MKPTELGPFPADWPEATLGDFNPFITSGSRGWARYYSDRGDLFVRITNMTRTSVRLDLEDCRFVRLPPDGHEGSRTQLRSGDVLISVTADIGIISLVDETVSQPAYVNQHIALVRLPQETVSPAFVAYFLAHRRSQQRFRAITDQGAKAGINLATVRDLKVVLPPTKAEQDAIARVLQDADALIESLDRLVAKKRQVRHGAMQELLTGLRRLPGFSQGSSTKRTEIGEIPVDWEVTTVGAEFSIQLGKMLDSAKNVGEAKPFLGNRSVQWGRFDLSDLGLIRLSPSELQRFRLRDGDLLVCEGGEVGRAAVWDCQLQECYYQKAIHRLRPKRGYDVKLMLNVLERLAAIGFLLNFVTQTSIAHLPKDKFETVPIPLPPTKEERSAISGVLSDMDAETTALEAKLAKARQVKQGMAQELLTGRRRLV